MVAIVAAMLGSWAQAGPARADATFNSRMLELVNQRRATAGLGPLQWSASLGSAAEGGSYSGCGFSVQGRSVDMGVRNYFSHTILGCGTQGVFSLLGALGIQSTQTGENIAWMSGTTDPLVAAERLTNDLMDSPAHRANILDPTYTHIGIGSWTTAPSQTWSGGGTALTRVWIATQVFAQMTVPAAPTVPGAPTNVRATGGDARITVSWNPPTSGGLVDYYAVYAWTATGYAGYISACATCTTATVASLTNGTAVHATVHPHGAAGWGATGYSDWVNVASPPSLPGAPTSVRATGGDARITVSWNPPTSGGPVDYYAVYAWTATGYAGYISACATCTTATVASLTNGTAVHATVHPHGAAGWGATGYSDWVNVAR